MPTIRDDLTAWAKDAQARIAADAVTPQLERLGRVVRAGDGIAMIEGLPDTQLDEVLLLEDGIEGIAVQLDEMLIGCVLLGDATAVHSGSTVHGTGRAARAPVGPELLGRVIDPLGRPLDDGPPPAISAYAPIEKPAPAIVDRALVTQPLATGLLAIDAMIPIGRGQRELIIGDRETGKTSIAVDAIINQRSSNVICVYAAIGQKASAVNRAINDVRKYGAPDRCIFVVGAADAVPGLQWIAPYAACSMAEYFVERGQDVLIVFDDLTKHAAVYREISLLLRQPPGREAYPGDIFYIHSRLLERAAKLSPERKGGSLTALPIAETQAGNISGYIPTNLISITDGQIILDARLFYEDQKPALDIGKSVSRVGGASQAPILKSLAESFRLDYAQFLELEVFTRYGTMVDERTRKVIDHGKRIRTILKQRQCAPLSLGEQVALMLALGERILDRCSLDEVERIRAQLRDWLSQSCPEVLLFDDRSAGLSAVLRGQLIVALNALADMVKRETTARKP